MNNIDKICKESSNSQEFAKKYFKYIAKLIENLDLSSIESFVQLMEESRRSNNTIFFAGNGGSAATASHMATDFGTDILKNCRNSLPFRALALTDQQATIMAIANDDSYDNVFVNQLRIHYRLRDVLVAISVSGNSKNVVKAAKWVKEHGGRVVGLVGFDGGELKNLCDVLVHVKTEQDEYGPSEDVHMILDHLLTSWLKYRVQVEKC